LQVTEGPDAGKLCLLDFGLVAQIPVQDREAMVSATIHLANRDWDALIDDFIALEFLPQGADRCVCSCERDRGQGQGEVQHRRVAWEHGDWHASLPSLAPPAGA
jgi:hypothetical protein